MATRTSAPSRGSMRQRGSDSWQLRVYQGIDPDTHQARYASRTVHGSRRAAQRALRELAVEVDHARTHAGTVGDLLERWFGMRHRAGRPPRRRTPARSWTAT